MATKARRIPSFERMPGRPAEHGCSEDVAARDQVRHPVIPCVPSAKSVAAAQPAPPKPAAAAPAGAAEDDDAAAAGHSDHRGALRPELLNPQVLAARYAVRGEIYLAAEALKRAGRDIIYTNIGNPHSLGARPKTFTRQVAALCVAPWLLDGDGGSVDGGNNDSGGDDAAAAAKALFPADARARARQLLASFPGGIGAYTDSRGAPQVRADVADFITRRDGGGGDKGSSSDKGEEGDEGDNTGSTPAPAPAPARAPAPPAADPDRIFLTDGASTGVRLILSALLRGPQDAVLVPVPQYPLYSAALTLLSGSLAAYELDEGAAEPWALTGAALRAAADAARAAGKCIRGVVIINPGNPTGQVMPESALRDVIRFAYDEGALLMADEVYQELVYSPAARPFTSARKALYAMGEPYSSGVELVSFHSASKGTSGECGLRGGYFELVNIAPGTVEQLYKLASINLCPNTLGQVALSCMVNPPKPGDPSHALWQQETSAEFASLRRRARMVADAFNGLDGVTCTATDGAMYAFPRLRLPPKAVAAAEAAGKAPDAFYCLKLLDAAGIVTVPGSGFGQQAGTFHLRTTILPREDKMAAFCAKFKEFHERFMAKYA